jgi:hypothetical protein
LLNNGGRSNLTLRRVTKPPISLRPATLPQSSADMRSTQKERGRSISFFNTAEDAPLEEGFPVWLAREIRANRALYRSIVAFVLATLLLATVRGDSFIPFLQEYFERVVRVLLIICCLITIVLGRRALAQRRRQSPVENLVGSLKGLAGSGLPVRYVYACLVLAVFMAAFLYNKMLIPEIAPFQWDATFARLDFALFGGHHPWELIHPLLSNVGATFALDGVYSSWVPMVFLFWAGAFASPRVPERLRVRFWMATVVSWVLIGLVMATMLSSAGPCYFTDFVSDVTSPYAGLNAYLADISGKYLLSSTWAKEILWQAYTGEHNLPGGISAMPSMHIAQVALFVAFAYSLNRRFGHVMLIYAALIFVGSIHLAWHYAVDGIVGAAAAIAVWWSCGIVLSKKAVRAGEPVT